MSLRYGISIDGTAIPQSYELLSARVYKGTNRIPFARIELRDGNPAMADFPVSGGDLFLPGNALVVTAGRSETDEQIFSGVIVRHSIKMSISGASILRIEARDLAHKLIYSRKNGTWYETTDSAVFSDLINNAGLTPGTIDTTSVTYPELYQLNSSDWDFLLTRAEANARLVIVNDGEVSVTAPDLTGTPEKTYTYGRNIYRLELGMDARNQVASTQAWAWDPVTQALISSEVGAEPTTLNTQGDLDGPDLAGRMGFGTSVLQHTGALLEPELQAWADGAVYRSRLARIQGKVTMEGDSSLLPGTVIGLAGVGLRFNGNAFVSAVTHVIQEGDWMSEVEVGLDQKQSQNREAVSEPAAGGLLPGVDGLQTGVVLALAGDPQSDFRIRIRLPILQDATDTGIWARMATFYAGVGRGNAVFPEIGDEVLVGFLQDDPRQPVILGALFSQANAPVVAELTDENPQKTFTTVAGMQLLFDEQEQACTITTPTGNQLSLTESLKAETDGSASASDPAQLAKKGIFLQDQHQNAITLNGDGILLQDKFGNQIALTEEGIRLTSVADGILEAEGEGTVSFKGALQVTSEKDLGLQATGNLDAVGNSAASVTSGSDALEVGGGAASLNSSGTATVNGDLGAELTSGATLTINGKMVNIN
ncbi:MAG: type VI secretion system tip protein VgrG [Bacteroidota bacterium]